MCKVYISCQMESNMFNSQPLEHSYASFRDELAKIAKGGHAKLVRRYKDSSGRLRVATWLQQLLDVVCSLSDMVSIDGQFWRCPFFIFFKPRTAKKRTPTKLPIFRLGEGTMICNALGLRLGTSLPYASRRSTQWLLPTKPLVSRFS